MNNDDNNRVNDDNPFAEFNLPSNNTNVVSDDDNPFKDQGGLDPVDTQDSSNPFAEFNIHTKPVATPTYENPFIEQSVQEKEEKEKRGGLFRRKPKEEDKTPQYEKISLRDVQNMTFPTEEEQQQQQQVNVVNTPTVNSEATRQKIKKVSKRIRNIIELGIFVGIILFCYFGYKSYSKDVNQMISYKNGNEIFELYRDKSKTYVIHKRENCVDDNNCNIEVIDQYDVKFDNYRDILIKANFDFTFFFKSGKKSLEVKNLNRYLTSHAVYAMIHNDPLFLGFNKFRDYSVISFQQKSEYRIRGFQFEENAGTFLLNIALGKKEESGYDLKIVEVHEIEDDLVFYINEIYPKKKEKWINETYPAISLEINKKPKSIKVINVNNGEVLPDYNSIIAQ